jgi:hypothetical protein
MGLDYVELVLAIEERFQIQISDEEAASAGTVGDLYHVVLSKMEPVPGEQPRRCFTSTAFYRLRRGLVDVLGCQRRTVRPSTRLEALLPWTRRRLLWKTLQRRTGLQAPGLCHSPRVRTAFLVVGMVSCIALAQVPSIDVLAPGTFAFPAILGLASGTVLARITRPLAVGLPRGVVTLGDLAKSMAALNYALLARDTGQGDRRDVWDTLCALMAGKPGLARDEITPDARIAEDLRIS